MPDVTTLVNPAKSINQRTLFSGPRLAVINRAPVTVDESVYVVVPSFSSDYEFGPCRWTPRLFLPHKGDECVVIFPESGEPWVLIDGVSDDSAEDVAAVFYPRGYWDALTLYTANSVVYYEVDGHSDPYYATTSVPLGIAPPASPWIPLLQVFEPDIEAP